MLPPWAPFYSPEIRERVSGIFRRLHDDRPAGVTGDAWDELNNRGAVELQEATGRACGECTLCCRLIPVQAMDKPAGVKCPACIPGGGCSIYAERPNQCRGFLCNWVIGEGPPAMRPDLVHCVFDFEPPTQIMRCHVHPQHADAWRSGPVAAHIRVHHQLGTNVQVIVQNGSKHAPPSWGIPGAGKLPFDMVHPDTGQVWCRFRLENLP